MPQHTTHSHHILLFLLGLLFFTGSFVMAGVWINTQGHTVLAQESLVIPPATSYLDLEPLEPVDETPITDLEPVVEEVIVEDVVEEEEVPKKAPVKKEPLQYIRVTDSCGVHYGGECLRVRSGPGTEHSVVGHLRTNMVLKVSGSLERDGHVWYRVIFDEWLRYPERVEGEWYVAADFVEVVWDVGELTVWTDFYATSTKQILIDLSEQKLTAIADGEVFMTAIASTGLQDTPTPLGSFGIFKKTPSRYMQGPLPGLSEEDYWDLPGVPWNMYFTQAGVVIHGAYWHENFGAAFSHGCVNLAPEEARKLYGWADLGTEVIVRK